MTDINIDNAVLVLCDDDTASRADMLTEKAAEHGARIAGTFAFPQWAAMAHDDLTEVDAVVAALSRAIATGRDLWCPFPLQDLGREQHIRRLSVALQRHGLNLLIGHDMAPCPTEGGYSAIDAALRSEVKAVDELHHAAMAAAGLTTLEAEIEAALSARTTTSAGTCRGEHIYSTRDAAAFLGVSDTWISRALREEFFRYDDGSPIQPLRVGRGRRRRFTVPMLREMARSCHRHGVLSRRELEQVLARLPRTQR
jgi:hypothetical protein